MGKYYDGVLTTDLQEEAMEERVNFLPWEEAIERRAQKEKKFLGHYPSKTKNIYIRRKYWSNC